MIPIPTLSLLSDNPVHASGLSISLQDSGLSMSPESQNGYADHLCCRATKSDNLQ